jgi:hypothetical protein
MSIVELIVIPVVNTYGFDMNEYKNANGVNLNRNYDTPEWTYVPDQSSSEYCGEEPLDQPETQAVANVILNNPDAVLFVDCHTSGNGNAPSVQNINWTSLVATDDFLYNQIICALTNHYRSLTVNLEKEFNIANPDNKNFGYFSSNNISASKEYAFINGIMGFTCETSNGTPYESTTFTSDVKKINAEVIGNILLSIIHHLSFRMSI